MTPLHPTADRSRFAVDIHEVASQAEMEAVCRRVGIQTVGARTCGCSDYDVHTNTLGLWLLKPRGVEDEASFATIGHELWHGKAGAYHDQWPRLTWCAARQLKEPPE